MKENKKGLSQSLKDIETSKKVNYNDIINYLKDEKKNMSFVIMIANNNGMTCASDSRSILNANTWYPEIENDTTKKVFKNKHMILGTFGPNKIYDRHLDIVRPLENVIEEILNISKNPFDFINLFKNRLIEDTIYNFLIGYKNEIYEVVIHKNNSTIYFKGQGAFWINTNCLPQTIKYPQFNIYDTLEIMKNKAYNCVEDVIKKVEAECLLKFVGGKIQIEIL